MLHVDWARIDATTEAEIAAQIAEDDVEAIRDAAACARRVRPKVGLSPGRVTAGQGQRGCRLRRSQP